MKRSRTTLAWLALLLAGVLVAPTHAATVTDAIASGFNGTDISGGNWIWFNSNFKYTGTETVPVTIAVENASIQFEADAVNYDLAVPDSRINLIPGLAAPNVSFDEGTNTWFVDVPSDFGDDIFLGGLAWQAPVDLPGGIGPVTWTADFSANVTPVTVKWKWGAAVYTNFTDDYDALDVNPTHQGGHAGVPFAFTDFVTGGARGGGGSNWTGSWSGTSSLTLQEPVSVEASTWASVKVLYR